MKGIESLRNQILRKSVGQLSVRRSILRLSSREEQADVIQAISPISIKLGQNEGYTKKSSHTKGFGFRIFLKVFSPPPPPPPNPGFKAKILKIEPKLAMKSEKPPDHRIQTILLLFSLKEDWSFSSLPQQFQII